MNPDILTASVTDGIAVITLGSAKHIYFNAEMGDGLTDALDRFASDPSVRVSSMRVSAPSGPRI